MKNKNFMIIVIGQVISLFGSAIQRFCMALYLLDLTGSAGVFSSVLAFSMIPYVLCAPLAGVLADSVSKKHIMVYLDLFCSGLIGIYAVILFQKRDHELIIAAVMFLLSVCYTLYAPAVTASIPQVVEPHALVSANGVIQQVGALANLLGPILAGILYGLVDIRFIVLINAVSFLAAAILGLFLDIPRQVVIGKGSFSPSATIREMKDCISYLKNENPVVLGTIASYGMNNIILVPVFSVLTPYLIKVQLGMSSEIYGLVEGGFALGMILGGLVVSIRPQLISMKKITYALFPITIFLLIMGGAIIFGNESKIITILFTIGGLLIMVSLGVSNVVSLSYTQRVVSQMMLGRVSAFSNAVATICIPLGQMVFGQLINAGVPISLLLGVMGIQNVAVSLFVRWNVRNCEKEEKLPLQNVV